MKPRDLPFYDIERSENVEISQEEDLIPKTSKLESGVKKVRLLVQENTKPLQSTLLSGYYKAKGVYAAAEDNYSRFNHPNMWFNISMISGSIVTGWVLQGFIFQKSARIRRLLTPVLLGSACATYFYPDKARTFGRNISQSGYNKFVDIKRLLNGKS